VNRTGVMVAGAALLVIGIAVLALPLAAQLAAGAPGVGVEDSSAYATMGSAVIEEAITIAPGFAVAHCAKLPDGAVLAVHVHVLSGGGVNVWVVDRGDWERFKRGEPFRYYTSPSRRGASESSILWAPPPGQEVCMVLDNTFSSLTPKSLRVRVELARGAQAGGEEAIAAYGRGVERPQPSRLSTLGAVLTATGLILAGLGARQLGSRPPPPAQHAY